MPPKKGKTKATAATKTPTRSTSTAAPATVSTNRGKEYDTTAAASRPRRASNAQMSTAPVKPAVKKTQAAAPATKKRGRPAKAAEDAAEPPKKRGRPAKATATANDEIEDEENEVVEPPKKRGKPAKAVKAETEPAEEESDDLQESDAEPPKKRGRPSKQASAGAAKMEAVAAQPAKKRGRPSKAATEPAEAPAAPDTPAPRKRHSGVTGGPTTKIASDAAEAADQLEEELIDEAMKSAKKGKRKASSLEKDADGVGKNYWLMKAEQVDRMEILKDGSEFNTKFTIDDLKAKSAPEPWEGVRNMVARNNMRAMKKGDLAFFYASQGKNPGITGIIEIVKEHEPDFTVTDESSVGYVEPNKRGKENQWSLVHVAFRKKLSEPVTLKQLQKYANGNGVLRDMQVIKQSRLSVAKVSEKEWDFIVNNLIEGYESDEEDGNDDDDDGLFKVKAPDPRPLNPNLNGGATAELASKLPSDQDGVAAGMMTDGIDDANVHLTSGTALPLTT